MLEKTRREYEKKLSEKDVEIAAREQNLDQRESEISKAEQALGEEVAKRLEREKAKIVKEEAMKARRVLAHDLEQKDQDINELRQVLEDRNKKLAEAQKAQARLKRRERDLEDAKREVELTVETRVQESLSEVRKKAKQEAEDSLKLKVSEKDGLIQQMQRQIEELKQKAEQGSEQAKGEVLEVELESVLRKRFPLDIIEPVCKGQPGADVLQHVVNASGQPCGTIIWESKRTKRWNDGWLSKLKDDQRAAKAEAAVLISQALPTGIDTFDQLEGVWVAEFRCAIPIATAIRQTLMELSAARLAGEGQQTKMDLVYRYLTGPRFRDRISPIVEKLVDMQEDLEKERRSTTRIWAKREEQIRSVIESTAGMYGDLQGIAGKSLQEINGLEANALLPFEHEEQNGQILEQEEPQQRHLRTIAPRLGTRVE